MKMSVKNETIESFVKKTENLSKIKNNFFWQNWNTKLNF